MVLIQYCSVDNTCGRGRDTVGVFVNGPAGVVVIVGPDSAAVVGGAGSSTSHNSNIRRSINDNTSINMINSSHTTETSGEAGAAAADDDFGW